MHSTPYPSSSGQTASHSAPKPPMSPRQKIRSQPRARASSSIAASACGLAYGPPQAAIFGTFLRPFLAGGRDSNPTNAARRMADQRVDPNGATGRRPGKGRRCARFVETGGPMSTGVEPRVAILGAGPIGLEAALAAKERGYEF